MTRVAVLGAGAFGTALAAVFARGGLDVVLWGRDAGMMAEISDTKVNARYLGALRLPNALSVSSDLTVADRADIVLVAVPAQQTRSFVAGIPGTAPRLVVAKGLETGTGQFPHDIAKAVGVVSGPGFATELAAGKPTALSLGCADQSIGTTLQQTLSTGALRLYLTRDMTGVALGGALKNVYAIACGLVTGADLGESARAALMTRGFAEMSRLGQALGAERETLVGLSGFGDLALTCTSLQSRNFAFGHRLGAEGIRDTTKTVEGIATAQAVLDLGKAHGIDLPIAGAVADVLGGRMDVGDAVAALMSRPLKREDVTP